MPWKIYKWDIYLLTFNCCLVDLMNKIRPGKLRLNTIGFSWLLIDETILAILNSFTCKTFSLRPNVVISVLNSQTRSDLEWFERIFLATCLAAPPWNKSRPRSSHHSSGKRRVGTRYASLCNAKIYCSVKTLLQSKFSFLVTNIYSFQGKGTIVSYFLCGKDGFDKPLPNLKEAASLEEHEFK